MIFGGDKVTLVIIYTYIKKIMILLETSITNRTPQFGGAGYGNHKNVIEKHFNENIDYKILLLQSQENPKV